MFLTNENVNSDYFLNKISKFNCDLFVSMSFNQIFKKRILNLPEKGVINCHAGKLPFYRGRNVLNWVLINDEKEFGVTTHFVDEGIDTGDIILQKVQKITDQDNYASLLHKAYKICSDLLYKSIKLIKNNDYKLISQKSIHPVGLYCIKRGIGDEVLNWNSTSRQVFNFVRAISDPGPIARSSINGNEIKIKKVELIKDAPYFLGFKIL